MLQKFNVSKNNIGGFNRPKTMRERLADTVERET